MPTTTYTLLHNETLANNTTTQVTISSISGSYRDLTLIVEANAQSSFFPRIQFNGDTSTNYAYVAMETNGTTALSSSGATETGIQLYSGGSFASASGSRAIVVTHILDYSVSDKHRPVMTRFARGNDRTEMIHAKWANISSAITSIKLFSSNGAAFSTGTTISLYGVIQ